MVTPPTCPAAVCERGRFTLRPVCASVVLVTMKMISSTRKMSVSGVTLISATTSSSRPVSSLSGDMAMDQLLVLARERELFDAEAQEGPECADLAEQPVVRAEGDDGDHEPRRRRDQGLRDARGHHGE